MLKDGRVTFGTKKVDQRVTEEIESGKQLTLSFEGEEGG